MQLLSENIEIREANAADANLLSVLGAVTFYEAYFEQDTAHDLANYITESFALDQILSEIQLPSVTFFIIYRSEKAVGYAKLRSDTTHESVKNESAIELQRIYILERVFGKQIGEILLMHCLETARRNGFKSLWLGVWEKNLRARKFYKKHGFQQIGTLEFPYGDSVGTNLVLQLNL